MKKILLAAILLITSTTSFAQENEVIRLSEPVVETDLYLIFGETVEFENEISLEDAITDLKMLSGKQLTIESEVVEVCQKKGCFFIAVDGNFTARIKFKDYGFFVPTDITGKTVQFIGTLEETELTEDEAKHYAEDAGHDVDEVSGSQKEYAITAISVLVPKS